MKLISKYNHAASEWGEKMHRLGYIHAYSQFLKNQIIASGPILDVGTGSGAFAQAWVAQMGSTEMTLMDPSRAMLSAAQDSLHALGVSPKTTNTRVEDFDPPSQFSGILVAHVIEHCIDPETAFQSFARWLKPGGRLYIVVSRPHWCNWLIWLRYRHRWFKQQRVLQMAHDAGLDHQQSYSFSSGPPSRTSFAYLFSKP